MKHKFIEIKEALDKPQQEIPNRYGHVVKVVLLYVGFGGLWILFSDTILGVFVKDPMLYQRIQTIKGWLYVVFTAILLFYLVLRNNDRYIELNDELRGKNEELRAFTEEVLAMEDELRSQYDHLENAKKFIEEQNLYYRHILDASNTALLIWTKEGTILHCNAFLESLVGYHLDEIVGKKWIDLFIPKDDKEVLQDRLNNLSTYDELNHVENQIVSRNGDVYHMLWNNAKVNDPRTNGEEIISFGINITKEKEQEQKIRRMAYIDPLTKLANRQRFEEDLRVKIEEGTPFSIISLDLDNFKQLNDLHGHYYGDLLLIRIGDQLQQIMPDCSVYRWGGDEFLLITYDVEEEVLNRKLEELLFQQTKTWYVNEVEYRSTVSIGVSQFPKDGTDVSTLVKNADLALYRAKEAGKGIYFYFSRDIRRALEEEVEIDRDLHMAIKNHDFHLNFQPLYMLETNEIQSFEVLLRWNHPQRGEISPGQFIPIAERSGLITKIDKWVVQRVFKILERKDHFSDRGVSINISSQTFKSHEFLRFLREKVEEYQVDPSCISFEVTEYTVIEDFDISKDIIHELKKLGFKISLDDFGTKYSSLNYLSKLPFDQLKIDKSYIDNIVTKERDRMVVKHIISLGSALNLSIVAEGIEFEAQRILLKDMGCHFGQGYFLSKPVDEIKINKLFVKDDLKTL